MVERKRMESMKASGGRRQGKEEFRSATICVVPASGVEGTRVCPLLPIGRRTRKEAQTGVRPFLPHQGRLSDDKSYLDLARLVWLPFAALQVLGGTCVTRQQDRNSKPCS